MEPNDLKQASGLVFEQPMHQVVDDVDVLCAPPGYELHSLAEYRRQPQRQTGTVTLHTPASFVGYTLEGNASEGRVYINARAKSFAAVLNHGTPAQPDWRDHVALYKPEYGPEYRAWLEFVRRGPTKQTDLIRFVEEHLRDVTEPKGADMLELVRDFRVASSGAFTSAQDLSNGSIQFQYTATNRSASTLEIPDHLTLSVPVFEGTPPVPVIVRFRYRLNEGDLTFSLEIAAQETLEREEFDKLRAQIEAGLDGWTIFDGSAP